MSQLETKPVRGYEDRYMVSSNGEVFSLGSSGGKQRTYRGGAKYITRPWEGRKLKPCLKGHKNNKYGYVNLAPKKSYKISRLVAEAFIPNPLNKPQVNHIDGDKLNDKVDNLEWCTVSENRLHAYRTGLQRGPVGTRSHSSKLNWAIVAKIRQEFGAVKPLHRELAVKYGIDQAQITRILNNKSWKEEYSE